ncbi:MAG: hypothetical protein K2Z81_15675, partial [Cyanobacteria bacterium]|nr:hypothetical protein [Cyanobacteriota bacterium]
RRCALPGSAGAGGDMNPEKTAHHRDTEAQSFPLNVLGEDAMGIYSSGDAWFCELGDKAPPIPAYPISLCLGASVVNELAFSR